MTFCLLYSFMIWRL